MKKYVLLTTCFLAATSFFTMAVAQEGTPQAPAGNGPPPPPAPPPAPPPPQVFGFPTGETKPQKTAEKVFAAINKLEKYHNFFTKAEKAYVDCLAKYKSKTPAEAEKLCEDKNIAMESAASGYRDAIDTTRRHVNRLAQEFSVGKVGKQEVQDSHDYIGKKNLPKKDKEDLMNELRKRLEQRKG